MATAEISAVVNTWLQRSRSPQPRRFESTIPAPPPKIAAMICTKMVTGRARLMAVKALLPNS